MSETWTYEQHLAKAEELAHRADNLAEAEVPGSKAAERRVDIEQTAARSQAHSMLAAVKKPAETPRAAPKPQRQQGQPKGTNS